VIKWAEHESCPLTFMPLDAKAQGDNSILYIYEEVNYIALTYSECTNHCVCCRSKLVDSVNINLVVLIL